MIQKFLIALQSSLWADMATGKMAAEPGQAHLNAVLMQAAVAESASQQNLQIIFFAYGFAAALILVSLYFLFRVRQQTDLSDKKTSLIVGVVLFGAAILLWILPAKFFPIPGLPPSPHFDMRTT